jgi:hypothetical protein
MELIHLRCSFDEYASQNFNMALLLGVYLVAFAFSHLIIF